MQNSSTLDTKIYNTLCDQLSLKTFVNKGKETQKRSLTKCNQVYKGLQTFLEKYQINNSIQLYSLDQTQINHILELTENVLSPTIMEFREMVLKFQKIVQNVATSDFQIKVDDEIINLHRMDEKALQSLLYNFRTSSKTKASKFAQEVQDKYYDITIEQLRILNAAFAYNSFCKIAIDTKIKFLEEHMINVPIQQQFTQIEFQKLFDTNLNIDQMNKIYSYITKQDISAFQTLSKQVQYQKEDIIKRYFNILEKCLYIQEHEGIVHQDILYAAKITIPKIIFKAFQIILNYKNYKIINSVLFPFYVPLVYISDPDETDIKQYLIVVNSEPINIQLKSTKYSINQNELDIRSSNKIEIVVTPLELQSFDVIQYTVYKKTQILQQIMNFEYNCLFFEGCVDLKYFDTNRSYYKELLAKNINNPDQIIFEMQNIGPKIVKNDTQKMIQYFKKLLNIEQKWF